MITEYMMWSIAILYTLNGGLLLLSGDYRVAAISALFALCTVLIFWG